MNIEQASRVSDFSTVFCGLLCIHVIKAICTYTCITYRYDIYNARPPRQLSWFITPITMVYGIYNFITIVTGPYKPTYILGASHCMYHDHLPIILMLRSQGSLAKLCASRDIPCMAQCPLSTEETKRAKMEENSQTSVRMQPQFIGKPMGKSLGKSTGNGKIYRKIYRKHQFMGKSMGKSIGKSENLQETMLFTMSRVRMQPQRCNQWARTVRWMPS